MYIPVFTSVKYVDDNGFLTPEMQIFNDILNQAMQNALSDNGWTIPQITAANLAIVEPEMPEGTLWAVMDVSPRVLVVKLDGTLQKITTTPYP